MRLPGIATDLRQAARLFRRRALLTSLALLTLSLGIGANAAMFSVFEAVLLRQLPYPDADRLVLLHDQRADGRPTSPTIPELIDVRESSRSFDGLTYFDTRDFQIDGAQEPEHVVGARVEPSFLSVLDVRPVLGRLFTSADGAQGSMGVVLLGNGLWRRAFGADPAVIGRGLRVNGAPHVIVGVLPETFSFGYLSPETIDMYVPYPTSAEYTSRTGSFANVRRVTGVARLAPGTTVDAAKSELAVVSRAMAARHPELYGGAGTAAAFVMTLEPLHEALTRNARPILFLLLGAVALVLLIGCVNTAQFLLAQAVDRETELAVRSALGASRSRLIRQVLSEALLLTGVGGLLGIVQAVWLTNALRLLIPRGTATVGAVAVDGSVLAFLIAVTLATAVASGIVPALRASRIGAQGFFASRGTTGARGRFRHALIAFEVAISVVLLVAAGVLLRSLAHLQRADGGYSTDRVSVMRVRGMGAGLGNVYSRYLAAMQTVSGIERLGAASSVLPGRPATRFTIVGEGADTAAQSRQQSSYQIVSGGYFATLGIPLEAGRVFTDDDTVDKPPVAIINREMARRFWPNDQPIGKQVRAGEGPRDATMTIVGIVGNVRPPFQSDDVPQLYVCYRQHSEPNMIFVVRTATGVRLPVNEIKQAIWSVERRQAVFGITTLEEQLSQATATQRAMAVLIGGFAILAVAMALSGAYTVVTFLLSLRFKEMAIRLAIGATGANVFWSLARPALTWTIAGLALGAAGAVMGCRVLAAAVAGVIPLDLSFLLAVAAGYLVVVALALASGARGALRIDPAGALRDV